METKPESVDTLTFSALLDRYLDETSLDDLSAEQYRCVASLVNRWRRNAPIGTLFTKSMLIAFKHWVSNGRAAATVLNKLRIYRLLWAYAIDEHGYTVPVPNLKRIRPPIPKRCPDAWTPEQFQLILDHVDAAPRLAKWGPDNWSDLLNVLWYTGSRITVILNRRVNDLQGCYLHLPAEETKTLVAQRCQLPPWLADRIRRDSAVNVRLFQWPRTIPTLREHYRAILRAAGLPCGRRDLLQKVRRTAATAVARDFGAEAASRLLGHTSTAVTITNYIDQTQLADRRVMPAAPNGE